MERQHGGLTLDLYTRDDLPYIRDILKTRLLQGEVGILPTDTIYGLSGNALDDAVVARILRLKRRRRPMSVIPHSMAWARLLLPESALEAFDEVWPRYVGAHTMLWPYAGRRARLPARLRNSGLVGLRQPDHWITDLARHAGVPLVTTSANPSRQAYMTTLSDLSEDLRTAIDFVVYEGPRPGPASTLVHLYASPVRLQPR